MKPYIEFLKEKMAISHNTGFDVSPEELTPILYPHVKDSVRWAVQGGCRAIFSSFGMQKTVTQLEIIRVILRHEGGQRFDCLPKACSRGVPASGKGTPADGCNLRAYHAGSERLPDRNNDYQLRTCTGRGRWCTHRAVLFHGNILR